jgi:hypothetical protein
MERYKIGEERGEKDERQDSLLLLATSKTSFFFSHPHTILDEFKVK